MSLAEDPWLAGVLGRPVYRVVADASEEPPGFHYAKVPVDDVVRVRELCGRGFSVVDVNVTLGLEGDGAADSAPAVEVEPARPEDGEALVEIAGSCFRYSRFHLDPGIPDPLADRVKREWVRSYVEGRRGIELLAALDGRTPVGFLAVLEHGDARVIDLVGVAPDAQGRGIGSALVSAFVHRHARHARELLVGTQIANVPSLRLYAAQGFVVRSSAYVLHRHLPAA